MLIRLPSLLPAGNPWGTPRCPSRRPSGAMRIDHREQKRTRKPCGRGDAPGMGHPSSGTGARLCGSTPTCFRAHGTTCRGNDSQTLSVGKVRTNVHDSVTHGDTLGRAGTRLHSCRPSGPLPGAAATGPRRRRPRRCSRLLGSEAARADAVAWPCCPR